MEILIKKARDPTIEGWDWRGAGRWLLSWQNLKLPNDLLFD